MWLVLPNDTSRSFPCPSSWLEEDDDPVVAKVNQRMQQITGLTVKTAELLQVGTLVLSDRAGRLSCWSGGSGACAERNPGWLQPRPSRGFCGLLAARVEKVS